MTRSFLFALAAAFCAASLSAATKVDKPRSGSFSAEIQFNPFNQDNSTTVGGLDRLKVRWFVGASNALRLRLGFGFDSNKYTPDKDERDDVWGRARKADFNLDLGWEHHWNVGKRASLYAGLQAGVVRHFASGKFQTSDAGDGYTITNAVPKNWTSASEFKKGFADRANVGWTAGTFAGIDVYLYRGLYVGTEVAIDAESRRSLDVKVDQHYGKDGGGELYKSADRERTTSLKYHVQPGIRLGWTF